MKVARTNFILKRYFNNLSYKHLQCNSLPLFYQEKNLDIYAVEIRYNMKEVSMTFKMLTCIVKYSL